MSTLLLALCLLPQAPAAASQDPAAVPTLQVVATFAVGGEGGWDYVTVDAQARRLYVPRGSHVLVLDADTGKQIGDITDTPGVHGVAVAAALGKGFTSNGGSGRVTVFDLKTLSVVKTLNTGQNPDALIYEPQRKRVYVGCGRSSSVSVIDADKLDVVGTVPVGGKPEALAADEDGRVFVNVENRNEIVGIDPEKLTADRHLPLAPGEEPTGLAIDPERHLLFSVCGNARMVVLDSATGKVLASPAIGKRVDGAAFDPQSGCVFSANGEGTLSVVATRGDKPFTVVQTLTTAPGARTIAFDSKTKRLYLPTAEYEPVLPAEGGRTRRPAVKPGTFKIVVVGS